MKSIKYLLPILLAAGITNDQLYAQQGRDRAIGQESSFERRKDETDEPAVRDFVQSKENIDIKKKANNLDMSGDVRFEWRHLHEKGYRVFAAPCSQDPCGFTYTGSGYSLNDDSYYYGDESYGYDTYSLSNSGTGSLPSPSEVQDCLFQRYAPLRGHDRFDNRLLPVSYNDIDVEFNLKFKYTYGKAWASAHLQFDNPAGTRGYNDCTNGITILRVGDYCDSFNSANFNQPSFNCVDHCGHASPCYNLSDCSFSSAGSIDSGSVGTIAVLRDNFRSCKGSGESSFINLKRAYMGYNVYADGVHRIDIEMGRRKLNDVFDSEIQFSSRFDGVLFKYAAAIDKSTSFFFDTGAFLIDERTNHFGYAVEFGFLDILGSGLDLKYSYIDWKSGLHRNRCDVKDPLGARFRNSQFTLIYYADLEFGKRKIPLEFYNGFVVNHAAKRNVFTCGKRANFGFYSGLLINQVDKEGDWSFDITYEYVQAQMASDCDVDGIGRGNILDERLTDIIILDDMAIIPSRGNGNFKGWSFEFLYAITDNLSIDAIYEFTTPAQSKIGGRHRYSNLEIEMIYAF